jgi:hypothetical protein
MPKFHPTKIHKATNTKVMYHCPDLDKLFDDDADLGDMGRDHLSPPPSLMLRTVDSVTTTAPACETRGWSEGETGVEELELKLESGWYS